MKFLRAIFILLAVYGLIVGPIGAGLMSLLCAIWMHWAVKRYEDLDRAWANDPRSARTLPTTLAVLDQAQAECTEPKNHA